MLAALRGLLLHAFYDAGAQITSARYEADPEKPWIVPLGAWSAPRWPIG